MRFLDRKEEPRVASDTIVEKTYYERKCPSCYKPLVQEKQEPVVYQFPSGNRRDMWKAQYGCDKCDFHNDLWLYDGSVWIPITPEDFSYLQSDGTKTNEDTLKEYLKFLRERDQKEPVRRNVQKFFGG